MPILYYFETLESWCSSFFGWQSTLYQIFAWKFLVEHSPPEMPCTPSPCGLNSQCREIDNHAVCSCLPDMIGAPPNCRPECLVSSECPLDKSCINQKCKNPCENVCGLNSRCTVVNHNPICSCELGYTGDAFVRCIKEEQRKKIFTLDCIPLYQFLVINSHRFHSIVNCLCLGHPPTEITPIVGCVPSPCGLNSQCKLVGETAVCSCLPNYLGRAPNCRPECMTNSECPRNLACINERCVDPCVGSCASEAICSCYNHQATCRCPEGYTGDPFVACSLIPSKLNFFASSRFVSVQRLIFVHNFFFSLSWAWNNGLSSQSMWH